MKAAFDLDFLSACLMSRNSSEAALRLLRGADLPIAIPALLASDVEHWLGRQLQSQNPEIIAVAGNALRLWHSYLENRIVSVVTADYSQAIRLARRFAPQASTAGSRHSDFLYAALARVMGAETFGSVRPAARRAARSMKLRVFPRA